MSDTTTNTDTNELYSTLVQHLDVWDETRRDREAAAGVDDLDLEDDQFATMSDIADDAIRVTFALVEALRNGAPVPDAWSPAPAAPPAQHDGAVSEAPYRCEPITDDPDEVDLVALKLGHGTVEHVDHRRDNETRASWGLAAVRAYVHRTRQYGEPPETVLDALGADLRHLCDVLGLDFGDVIEGSRNHYDHEVRGE